MPMSLVRLSAAGFALLLILAQPRAASATHLGCDAWQQQEFPFNCGGSWALRTDHCREIAPTDGSIEDCLVCSSNCQPYGGDSWSYWCYSTDETSCPTGDS
jgi:hypothetical protein